MDSSLIRTRKPSEQNQKGETQVSTSVKRLKRAGAFDPARLAPIVFNQPKDGQYHVMDGLGRLAILASDAESPSDDNYTNGVV